MIMVNVMRSRHHCFVSHFIKYSCYSYKYIVFGLSSTHFSATAEVDIVSVSASTGVFHADHDMLWPSG